jgi:hypothetical protein
LAAAAALLTETSSGVGTFSMGAQFFDETDESLSTAELNSSASFEEEQAAVDMALAGLQMEEDAAMVCSTEGTGNHTADESVLAVFSSTASSFEEQFSSGV